MKIELNKKGKFEREKNEIMVDWQYYAQNNEWIIEKYRKKKNKRLTIDDDRK